MNSWPKRGQKSRYTAEALAKAEEAAQQGYLRQQQRHLWQQQRHDGSKHYMNRKAGQSRRRR
jgi:hypothetical protein